MKLKPDDLPPIEKDEARRVEFRLSGAVGANTINTFSIESVPAGLTFGTPSISGTNVTVLVTGAVSGAFTILATGVLSSGETVKGRVRVKVLDVNACGSRGSVYGSDYA